MMQDAARLLLSVREAFADRDLDGHICALVLRHGRAVGNLTLSPWHEDIEQLLESPLSFAVPGGGRGTAVLGCRLALGRELARSEEFAAAAKRELGRAPMPPAACIRDEERFLLGVAAGIGAGAPQLAAELVGVLQVRENEVSLRQVCIDLWAQSLANGISAMDAATANRALELLTAGDQRRPPTADEDRIATYWLATRLLDAAWKPSDTDLRELQSLLDDSRRAVMTVLATGRPLSPTDCALILDAFSSSPASRLERQSALNGVLAVVERFPASASVLGARQRNRAAFVIDDEYDVQDLFHALVLPVVPDLVPEDPTPKIAGKSSRLDFSSKTTKLGVEIKHLKNKRDLERVRREVLLDEATYQEHPYVETVVVFISDPNRHLRLADRTAFEADLSKPVAVAGRTVAYITRVR